MGDPQKPPDYGLWIRGRDVNDQAETIGSGARVPAVVSFTSGAGPATGFAFVVSNIGAGGAGVSTVTADQGLSGTQAWPVAVSGAVNVGTIVAVSVSALPSVLASISALPSVLASISAIPAVSAIQSGAWTANVSVSANVSQLVSVSAIPSIVASVSAIPSIVASVSAIPAISVGTIAQPIAVQPRMTGLPTTVSFSMTQSGSTTVAASSNGTRIFIKGYGVFNGDSAGHPFLILNGATNSTAIPAFLAANGGGHNIGFPEPFPLASNVGLAISVVGALGGGNSAVQGYFILGHETTA